MEPKDKEILFEDQDILLFYDPSISCIVKE
jgi:hypothetical protein